MSDNPQNPEMVEYTKTVTLEQVEFDVANRLVDQKEASIRQVGLRELAKQQAIAQYGQVLQGEQRFMTSLATKHEMPGGTKLTFGKDMTLTGSWMGPKVEEGAEPPEPAAETPVEPPEAAETPPTEEVSGEPA